MRHSLPRLLLAGLLLAAVIVPLTAQERDRAQVPDQFKWNLADLYPSDAAWRAAKDKLAAELPQLRQFEGKLGSSAAALADALDKSYAANKELSRLYVYASLLADQDTRDSGTRACSRRWCSWPPPSARRSSYIEPEILRFEKSTVDPLPRQRAAAQALRVLPAGHRAPRASTR